uniref:Uncharacterized protein n=1 Tax=Anguilla anguilla TaxID=7936 RepID=A0A0E9XZP3_ANGAN
MFSRSLKNSGLLTSKDMSLLSLLTASMRYLLETSV